MKKVLLFLVALALYAQEPEQKKEPSYWDFHPLHVGGNGIAIGKADVKPRKSEESGTLLFNKVNAFTSIIVPVSRTSYFFPRIEWNAFTMHWDENPKFAESHFQYMQFVLTFLTTSIEKWRWIARGDFNLDVKHFSHPGAYGLYSALLWGTYEMHRKWHFHIGALGYTGFEGSMVYPIIGLDFSPNKRWFFQGVFPITYSMEYIFNREWRLCLKARPLKERFRTGKLEPQPKSVFSYSTMGAEINLHYEKFLRCEAELFLGYNFGGSFYIKNERGQNALYTDVEGAPYAGASLNWGF